MKIFWTLEQRLLGFIAYVRVRTLASTVMTCKPEFRKETQLFSLFTSSKSSLFSILCFLISQAWKDMIFGQNHLTTVISSFLSKSSLDAYKCELALTPNLTFWISICISLYLWCIYYLPWPVYRHRRHFVFEMVVNFPLPVTHRTGQPRNCNDEPNSQIRINWFVLSHINCLYLPPPPLGQDMTQGQFLSGV